MIHLLDNKNQATALKIQNLFRASYQVEAELLEVVDFPPLKRPLQAYIDTKTDFYGYWKDDACWAIVEVERLENMTDIHSLVVHPDYFRQGLGRQLMNFILKTYDSDAYIVETGWKNEPAKKLYQSLGFKEVKKWTTQDNIEKVKFIKSK